MNNVQGDICRGDIVLYDTGSCAIIFDWCAVAKSDDVCGEVIQLLLKLYSFCLSIAYIVCWRHPYIESLPTL